MPLVLTQEPGIGLTPNGANLEVGVVASEVLDLIKAIDGSGSGLDADLLDGLQAAAFATAAQGLLAAEALQPGSIAVSSGVNGVSLRLAGGIQICYRTVALGDRKATGSGAGDDPHGTAPTNITWQQSFSGTPSAVVSTSTDAGAIVDRSNLGIFRTLTLTGMTGLQSVSTHFDSISTANVTAHVIAIGPWA